MKAAILSQKGRMDLCELPIPAIDDNQVLVNLGEYLMFLRKDIEEVIARTKSFYETESRGSALILVRSIDSIKLPSVKPLNLWRFPEDLNAYLDQCIDRLVFYWKNRKNINDDFIPSIAPYFGLAEHFSYIGGKRFLLRTPVIPFPLLMNGQTWTI